MPAERFFINSPLVEGQSINLEGQEFHHLAHVMRGRVGDAVEIVNGSGGFAEAKIERIQKHQAQLHIHGAEKHPKPSAELILVQAMPRINRLDFILEKGTELGATQIHLVATETCERKSVTDSQLERFQSITIAAMKQCGRLYYPILSFLVL